MSIITSVYIEILSLEPGSSVLKLLNFPFYGAAWNSAHVKASYVAAYRRKKLSVTDRSDIISQLSKTQFNEVVLNITRIADAPDSPLHIDSVEVILVPNVLSTVWLKTTDWGPVLSHSAANELATLDMRERGVELLGIPWPTVQVIRVNINPTAAYATVLSATARLIANEIPPDRIFPCLRGGASIHIFDKVARNSVRLDPNIETSFLNHNAVRQLKDRFPLLQPIMIGRLDECRALAEAAGPTATLIPATNAESSLAVVALPDSVYKDPDSRKRLAAFVADPAPPYQPPVRRGTVID